MIVGYMAESVLQSCTNGPIARGYNLAGGSTMEPKDTDNPTQPRKHEQAAEYEPPCIETVLTPEELEREVHYAGGPVPSPP